MKLYTIGVTQKTAERFCGLLAEAGMARVVDVRLKPGGQLSGFVKNRDLPYFLERLNGCRYVHMPELAPSPEDRDDYRRGHDWSRYVEQFEALMGQRGIPGNLDQAAFAREASCLLCSGRARPNATGGWWRSGSPAPGMTS